MQSNREAVFPALGSLTELVAAATAFANIDYESDTETETEDEDTIILNDTVPDEGTAEEDMGQDEVTLFSGMFA